ncbi:MAG: hypothetical protein A2W35_03395 [Chloroflexi bacterium RBG_16_57_11]|nr:MAG: hypothetical protein A2W35_03395 [Chloroflexi bacterium RBG_16_57_11]
MSCLFCLFHPSIEFVFGYPFTGIHSLVSCPFFVDLVYPRSGSGDIPIQAVPLGLQSSLPIKNLFPDNFRPLDPVVYNLFPDSSVQHFS